MKEFETAAELAVTDEDEGSTQPTPFRLKKVNSEGEVVDERVCNAYRPGDGQLAVLMAMTTRHSNTEEQIAGMVNFFASLLDTDSHNYVVNRLLDRNDPFGIRQVQGIVSYLVEVWSGRPTQSSSGSTQSPQSDGPRSTQRTPALT